MLVKLVIMLPPRVGAVLQRTAFWLLAFCFSPIFTSLPANADTPESIGIDYDIVYVRYTRDGDRAVNLPDGETPYTIEPGADLMLLHPDGSEEILVDCRIEGLEPVDGGEANCSVQDPVISYDGNWVYYSKYVDMGEIPVDRFQIAWIRLSANAFIFKMALNVPVGDRQEIQLTTAGDGFATNKLSGNKDSDEVSLFGIRDLGPAPLPDGRLMFTSNRDAAINFRQEVVGNVSASTISQLYIMDDHDGLAQNKNLRLVGHSNLNHVQHPMVLKDGRVLFSNWDNAGLRESYATQTLYFDHPDGGAMEQFLEPHHINKRVEHFATEVTSGDIIVGNYYPKMASWGFGTLLRAPVNVADPAFIAGPVLTPDDEFRYFSRKGTDLLTPHSTGAHEPKEDESGRYAMPSAGPNDSLLVSYSDGPVTFNPPCGVNCNQFPRLDAGIYFIPDAGTNSITDPYTQLVMLKNDPDYNEIWPRAVVPYRAIHGVDTPSLTPPERDYEPTERDRGLVPGSPVGIVGSSSMQNRESAPLGRDRFNQKHGKDTGDDGWHIQGSDAGVVTNDDLWGVRILVMSPDRYHDPYIPSTIEKEEKLMPDTRADRHIKGYFSLMSENWKILGEFPVRNNEGVDDPDGEEDTSWLAKIPANIPHLIQSIDRFGMTLSTEQTWRHVNPGETFANCGGCHAHSIEKVDFTNKWADRTDYNPWDLVNQTPMLTHDDSNSPQVENRATAGLWGVEFRNDVLPILEKCKDCHTSTNNQPPANDSRLAMFDSTLSGFEGQVRTYRALAHDFDETYTHGTTIPTGKTLYYPPQRSRYIRALQARASYLSWQIYGQRLDGRSNEDLPGTLDSSHEDLDFAAPVNCAAATVLTNDEKGLITRWIDLGAPIDLDRPRLRYTDDTLLPSMTLAVMPGGKDLVELRVGAIDIESGIDIASSRIDVTLHDGSPIEIDLGSVTFDSLSGVGLYTMDSVQVGQITPETPLHVDAVVYDNAGNHQRITRRVEILDPGVAGSVQFSILQLALSEDVGTIQLEVNRGGGSFGDVSVDYAVVDGSAELGADYLEVSGSLSWNDGESGAKNISITFINDAIVEDDETLTVGLSNPTNGSVLGAQRSLTITINDDDISSPGNDGGSTGNDGGSSGGALSVLWLFLFLSLLSGNAMYLRIFKDKRALRLL